MNLCDCYIEEDLFPKMFTDHEEREYGILFFNTDNKDSYDSNHAVIYKDKIHDIQYVLSDITEFYKGKGSRRTDIFQRGPAGWITLSYPRNTEKQVSVVLCFITMWSGAGITALIMSIYGRTEKRPKEYTKKAATE